MPWLIPLLIGIALQVAGSIVTAMARRDAPAESGIRLTVEAGGDLSPRFIVGRHGTRGQLRYRGTWGNAGGTPNAYLSRVIEVSCLPIRGYSGWYVNKERVSLASSKTGDLGYAVLKYRVKGKDHLWINPYVGGQVAPDPLMLAKFGTDPDQPYAGMIGRGCGYFVVTALVNRELFQGAPDIIAEVDGIALDDPRGAGQHDNPIAAAYTLLKGLRYGGEWIWGPQGVTANNFRSANLKTEADKCDVRRALVGGGTEKRFRIGLDIALDEEPHAVMGELLNACSGRWVDLGGVYRFLVGEPAAPVLGFTDEDLVISAEQPLDPFPGLEAICNGMTATYPEPAVAWEMAPAPDRYSSVLEAEDGGRRLPFSTVFRAAPHAIQVQELMRSAVEDARRFRRHSFTAPPEWWEYEPLDAVAWTSARNGYAGKSQLIVMMDDLPNGNQFVALQEIDPSDYNWTVGHELPTDIAPLQIARPAPHVTTGITAAPYTVQDAGGADRRAGIEVFWDAGLVDVRSVSFQFREHWGDKNAIANAIYDYDIDELRPSRVIANPAILSANPYEVRGIYLPFSSRRTRWSNQDVDGTEGPWILVTTPVVPDITAQEILKVAKEQFDGLAQIRTLIEQFRKLGTIIEEVDRENYIERDNLARSIEVRMDDLSASFDEVIEVALGPGGAIATALQSLYAAMGGNDAAVNVRWFAQAGEGGFGARYSQQAAVNDGKFRAASQWLDVPTDPRQPTMIGWAAGRFAWYTSAGVPIVAMDEAGVQRSANGVKVINWVTGAESTTIPG